MVPEPTSRHEPVLRRGLAALATGALALALTLTGCGDDNPASDDPGDSENPIDAAGSEPEAQPQPGTEVFGQGDFDNVPLIAGSEQVGPTDVTGDAVAATYTVDRLTAAQAVEQMAALLADNGWTRLVAPIEEPEGAFRTEWSNEERRLEVVATDVDSFGADGSIQYSLVLLPDLDPVEFGNDAS